MKKFGSVLLLLILLLNWIPAASAAETESAVEIYTVEDLMAMANDPIGDYILMEDLDLAGVEWKPLDFQGTFNGNGKAILNLTLTQPGQETALSYDGNQVSYVTQFTGLFGVLRNAVVENLKLINVRCVMETEESLFVGGIAGYCQDSKILNCEVRGTLELRAGKGIYGVGGVAGYGSGAIENTTVDVTLIAVDTVPDTKGEQFLGGVYGTGFIDSVGNTVKIDGYISEFGYVHSGGITGMYMQQPLGAGVSGRMTGNSVTGKITFFERNENRRAYCAAYAGETLAQTYTRNNNQDNFQRKEIWNDTTELRPCTCSEPSFEEHIREASCNTFGYTSYVCTGCGYTTTDHYTLTAHTITQWRTTVEPTTESEGQSVAICDNCRKEFTRVEPKLEIVETEPTVPPMTEPVLAQPKKTVNWQLPLMGGGFAFLLAAAFFIGRENRKKK